MFSSSEFINESVSISIKNDGSYSSKGFGGEPLNFGVFFTGFNEPSGVNLNSFHIDDISSDGTGHLDSVPFAVITIGGGEGEKVGSVFHE